MTVKVHGKGRPRKWIKLYLAINAKTQEIVAELTTDSATGDPTAFPILFAETYMGSIGQSAGNLVKHVTLKDLTVRSGSIVQDS